MEITAGQQLAEGTIVLEVCDTSDGLGRIVCLGVKGLDVGLPEDWGTTWYTLGEVLDMYVGG